MLQYPMKIPIGVTLRYMALRYLKNLNQNLYFWNLGVKGFNGIYIIVQFGWYLEGSLKKPT